MAQIDIEELRCVYRGTGSDPYPPERLLAIALFEILNGESSPDVWCRDADTREQCRLLGLGIAPKRSTWYEFRDRAGKFIEKIHQRLIHIALEEKIVDPTECCLDGTFTAAAASRHKIFNLRQINRRLSKIKKVIANLDDPTQRRSSRPLDKIPGWIAPTGNGRKEQLKSLRAAKAKILEYIEENRTKSMRYQRDEGKILVSPADVDAVIGKDKKKVIRPLYNTQYMSGTTSDVIFAYQVWAKNNDQGTLVPMIEKTQSITGGGLSVVHADCGYCSILDLQDCARIGIDLYAPVQDNNGSVDRKAADGRNQIPANEFRFDQATKSLHCPAGHAMNFRSRVQVPRADGRYVTELRYEQDSTLCIGCPLAGTCLQPEVKRRTVSRLSEQELLDGQQKKIKFEINVLRIHFQPPHANALGLFQSVKFVKYHSSWSFSSAFYAVY